MAIFKTTKTEMKIQFFFKICSFLALCINGIVKNLVSVIEGDILGENMYGCLGFN
jgi:hypothetical protein